PEKFASEGEIFYRIQRGDRIFIGTACGQPQYLLNSMVDYVNQHPKALLGTELFQVWTLGLAPYMKKKFERNFRMNSFFIGEEIREAVNQGLADYTPVFLSQAPRLFREKLCPIDVALIQTTLPDAHGYLNLGISVDIVKAAAESAKMVIVQMNANMPRTYGDGIIHIKDVNYIVHFDEPMLEVEKTKSDKTTQRIAKYIARIVQDGDTIQVGYGRLGDVILSGLLQKKHLGVHTELISHGIVELLKKGVIDNSHKNIDRGKTVASFCIGTKDVYDYIADNPQIEFRPIDYTNNPLVIASIKRLTAINTALEIDLTGQATSESIGSTFYSGIGGQADFMRAACFAPGGKSILVLKSTASNGKISRIVPMLKEGSGVTLNRGDVHYVVTEYGIAYLHGQNIRERAMSLISIAHPKFRSWLLEEARKLRFIYQDQKIIPGADREYPEHLEARRTTHKGINILLRPVRLNDEPLIKEFFYSLSDASLYKRFSATRADVPHDQLQDFIAVDYMKHMVILAIIEKKGMEKLVGLGHYCADEHSLLADVAIAVKDDYQNKGVGAEIFSYLIHLAKKQGLTGFTAQVLANNAPILHLIDKLGFYVESEFIGGVYRMRLHFSDYRWGSIADRFEVF
ncbi:acetyl-CoA hydrolase, partial [candidate division KSB1 bacterium RBG_16_48_16]